MRRSLLLATILLFGAAHLEACQCGGWPTVVEAVNDATSVFEGVVVAKSPVLGASHGYWFVVERWTFAVDRSWKGSDAQVVVTEGYSNCSRVYSLGQKEVVYAYRHESRPGELEAHQCGEPRGDPAEQLKVLGTPSHVFARSTPRPESGLRRRVRHSQVYTLMAVSSIHNSIVATRERPGSPTGLVIIAAGVFVLVQLVGLVLVRRQRVKIASLLAFTVLILVSWGFFIASRQLRGGYFGHLIEYECPSCPGG